MREQGQHWNPQSDNPSGRPRGRLREKVRWVVVGGPMVLAEAASDITGPYGARDLEAGLLAIIGRHPAVKERKLTAGERTALVVGAVAPFTPPTVILTGYEIIFQRQVKKALAERERNA
jgi:hypothetical protein